MTMRGPTPELSGSSGWPICRCVWPKTAPTVDAVKCENRPIIVTAQIG